MAADGYANLELKCGVEFGLRAWRGRSLSNQCVSEYPREKNEGAPLSALANRILGRPETVSGGHDETPLGVQRAESGATNGLRRDSSLCAKLEPEAHEAGG
jgi:hypothetical protein